MDEYWLEKEAPPFVIQTLVHFVDGAQFGGVEQVVLYFLANLDRRRWRPVLFHHPEPGLALLVQRAKSLDVNVREVPRARGRCSLVVGSPTLIRALRAENPAIFHAHLNHPLSCRGALISAALAGVPAIVATVHSFPEISLNRRTRALRWLEAMVVDRYIAVSHDVSRQLSHTFHIPARKIDVVHNGIPLPVFEVPVNGALRSWLMGGTEHSIVLVVGRLDINKGHRYLLRAAALVPEAVLVVAGEGPERANLEAQARELGVNNRVLFLGHRQDVPELLACADLLVLPSLFEGLPVSVLEAMAAGKPVIASAVGGNNEAIVHGETGLLVPPADPAGLAAAIRMVLSNPPLAQRLGQAGKARAQQQFSAVGMVRRVAQIYDQILTPEAADGRGRSHA